MSDTLGAIQKPLPVVDLLRARVSRRTLLLSGVALAAVGCIALPEPPEYKPQPFRLDVSSLDGPDILDGKQSYGDKWMDLVQEIEDRTLAIMN